MSSKKSGRSGPGSHLVCPWVHKEATCDGCRTTPISGYRYKCKKRPDFDLCSFCLRKEPPAQQANYARIERCQASKPYQIGYIECHDCGAVPIKGPRYQHKGQANVDLCESCFQKATSSQIAQESDFEKIEETKIKSFGKKHHPALHFDKICNECKACPILGPRYTSIKNPNYDVCAFCHDQVIKEGRLREGDFFSASRPDGYTTFHLNIKCCQSCGAFPVYGTAFQHKKKLNKTLCLLCFFNVKEEKKCLFLRLEAPPSISNFKFRSPPNSTAAPHMTRNNSAPAPRPTTQHDYQQRSTSLHEQSSGQQPIYNYPPQHYGTGVPPASSYQQTSGYSASLHPRPSYAGATPGSTNSGYFASLHSPNTSPAAAPEALPNPQQQQQMMAALCRYYQTQDALRQQQILAFIQKHRHASHQHQMLYLQQFLHKVSGVGGGGGGGGGISMSSIYGTNSQGGIDLSSIYGGNNQGGGIDLSSIYGTNNQGGIDLSFNYGSSNGGNGGGGGMDYSSLFGGNNGGGGGMDFSSLFGGNGGGGGGMDYSSLGDNNGGGGVDFSFMFGGDNSGGGMDYSQLFGGGGGGMDISVEDVQIDSFAGGGVMNGLLGAFGGMNM